MGVTPCVHSKPIRPYHSLTSWVACVAFKEKTNTRHFSLMLFSLFVAQDVMTTIGPSARELRAERRGFWQWVISLLPEQSSKHMIIQNGRVRVPDSLPTVNVALCNGPIFLMGMVVVRAEEGGVQVMASKFWPRGTANHPLDKPSVQLQGPTFRDAVGHFGDDITFVKVWTLCKLGDQTNKGPVTTIVLDEAQRINGTEDLLVTSDHTELLSLVAAEVDWRLFA